MNIGITGATGFIGRHLAAAATAAGHRVVGFSRRGGGHVAGIAEWRRLSAENVPVVTGLDAVIHLAGESVATLWTAKKRAEIIRSRVEPTQRIVEALGALPAEQRPRVFICASAVGYYGDQGDEVLDESAAPGRGFLSEVTRAWEKAAIAAEPFGVRVVRARLGIVLGTDGGMYPLLRRVFGFFLGGRLGSGRQWMPWVHVDDVCALLVRAAGEESFAGPVNVTAPEPVTNAEFTRQLARSLGRIAPFPVPAAALRLVARDQATMFLDSQRAIPAAALRNGHDFHHRTLESALQALAGK